MREKKARYSYMVHVLNISNLLFTTLAHIIKASVQKYLCSIRGKKLEKSILNSLHDLLHNAFTDIIFCTAKAKKSYGGSF